MTWRALPARPCFLELINSGELPTGRALVAGCGRGYAVAALASAGRSVTGLEISDTAKAAADEYLATALGGEARYQTKTEMLQHYLNNDKIGVT